MLWRGISLSSWFEGTGVLDRVRELLIERSCAGYVVGGYVRDRLLGRRTRDLDLAVEGEAITLAREMANRLGGAFVLLDEQRQTARVVLSDRDERYYVDFASLRGDDLEIDLASRDFTVNAMAVDAQDRRPAPEVIDPFGGQQDLREGVLRAVSDDVFRDDPVRLLRAVRFATELEMIIEGHTEQLMHRDASLISSSSPERSRDELCWVLSTERSESGLRYLDEVGILCALVPELEVLRGVEQPPPHHEDAFHHSLGTVGGLDSVVASLRSISKRDRRSQAEEDAPRGEMLAHMCAALAPFADRLASHLDEKIVDERSRVVLLKLAGLLHDSGKGTTGKVDDKGRIHFFGHTAEGAALAGRILRRLRFGNREVRLVQTVVRHHMRPLHLAQQERISRRAIHRFFRDTRSAGVDVLLHSLGDNFAIRYRANAVAQWRRVCDTVGLLLRSYYEEYDEVVEPPPLITGDDLMDRLGLQPGPQIGRLLRLVREAQVAGEVKTRHEALRLAQKSLVKHE